MIVIRGGTKVYVATNGTKLSALWFGLLSFIQSAMTYLKQHSAHHLQGSVQCLPKDKPNTQELDDSVK